MDRFNPEKIKRLYLPSKSSHKGQNGKLMIIGGSHLFHGASLWALKVASRIVDMVFYASTPENNTLTEKLKSELYDFIAIPRSEIENYVEEADTVLLGPGLVRTQKKVSSIMYHVSSIKDILEIQDEGEQTYYLTKYLLDKYRNKKWVIDAGSLQMMEPEWLKWLNGNAIITPHRKEFETLFGHVILSETKNPIDYLAKPQDDNVNKMAKEFNCVILLKGQTDIVCAPEECTEIEGGNAGMTKGGTGDVLAGLVAALFCKNDLFLAAVAGSYINKKAGDELYKRVGSYFNASDLADEIPKVMNQLISQ